MSLGSDWGRRRCQYRRKTVNRRQYQEECPTPSKSPKAQLFGLFLRSLLQFRILSEPIFHASPWGFRDFFLSMGSDWGRLIEVVFELALSDNLISFFSSASFASGRYRMYFCAVTFTEVCPRAAETYDRRTLLLSAQEACECLSV